MFETNAVNGSSSNYTTAGQSTQTLSQDQFLNLLVTQLKNQDPLEPMESSEYASQLAEFSSLEQLASIDANIEEGINVDLVLTQAINNTLAATLIGKEATAMGNGIEYVSGEDTELNFRLSAFAQDIEVQVMDQAGNVVRVLKTNSLAEGDHAITWDGKNDHGEEVPEGNYSFSVSAKDGDGNSIYATAMIKGLIASVRFENGSAVLIVNGREINFSNVLEIGT